MKGLLSTALALFSLTALAAGEASDRPRVVVVKSSSFAAYSSVVAGFGAEVRGAVEEVTLPDSASGVEKALEEVGAKKPALVLAIGPAAATAAKRQLTVPVIFTMVPYFEKYDLEAANVTGIALTNDLRIELDALAAASRGAKRIGILHDPRYSKALVADARKIAEAQNQSIVPLALDNPGKVDKVLKASNEKVDAMLIIADKTVGNAAVVRRLIQFCADQKLPLVALSASQVKEGALFSLSPSYVGIGQQAGRLANRIVHEKIDPGALAVAQPEVLDMAVNLTTAKKLGGECDVGMALFRFAAGKGYPVRVFE